MFLWASMGLYALAGVLQWHLDTRINVFTALALLLSAGLLMWTPLPMYYHFAGAAILVFAILHNKKSATASNIEVNEVKEMS